MDNRDSDCPSTDAASLKISDIFDEMCTITYQMDAIITRMVEEKRQKEEQRLTRETGTAKRIASANGVLNNVELTGKRLEHDAKVSRGGIRGNHIGIDWDKGQHGPEW